jgi:hypothetical protein
MFARNTTPVGALERGGTVFIASGDRDTFQLASAAQARWRVSVPPRFVSAMASIPSRFRIDPSLRWPVLIRFGRGKRWEWLCRLAA